MGGAGMQGGELALLRTADVVDDELAQLAMGAAERLDWGLGEGRPTGGGQYMGSESRQDLIGQ